MVKAPGALRLLVGVALVASGIGLAAPPVAAAPGLTVTPATGLLDQQVVTVTGGGFADGERVLVVQCAGVAPAGCPTDPIVNTNGAYATADSTGTVRATLRLSRVLALESGDISCADGGCAVVALTRDEEPVERARTAVDFEATGTAPAPPDAQLAVTTSAMRADGGTSRWTGSGYLPWFRVVQFAFDVPVPLWVAETVGPGRSGAYVSLCASPPSGWDGCRRFVSPPQSVAPGLSFQYQQWVPVTPDGTVAHTVDLPRMWSTEDGRIDCAALDCSLALEQDGAPHSNIVDVAWAPEWAPWPSASAFVGAVYPAVLGRPATASERSHAITDLTNRTLTGFTFLRQLAARPDGRRWAEITRLYRAALGRRPDGNGLVYWEGELRRTGSMATIAAAFGRTPEFRAAFSGTDAETVDQAYLRTLGRLPTPGEAEYWVGRLRAGLARTHMVHLFSRAPEYLRREAGRSEAAAVTVALLRRGPTQAEWDVVGPDALGDYRTLAQRADDLVLRVLSSNQLAGELG